jgi:hypothetical protein
MTPFADLRPRNRLLTPVFLAATVLAAGPTALVRSESQTPAGQWRLELAERARGQLETDDGELLRVVIDESPAANPRDVRLLYSGFPVLAGDAVIQFEGRAQWRRPFDFGLSRSGGESLGLAEEGVFGAEWYSYRVPFQTTAAASSANLHFDLGADPASVEIKNVVLRMGEQELALAPPAAAHTPSAAVASQPAPPKSPAATAPVAPAEEAGPAPSWSVIAHEAARAAGAILPASDGQPRRLRIELGEPGSQGWHVQTAFPAPAVDGGKTYQVKLRVRADAERNFSAAVSKNGPPWNLIGPYQTFKAAPEWREFHIEFTASAAEPKPRVQLDLGGNAAAVEVANVVWMEGDSAKALLDLSPPPTSAPPALAAPSAATSPWSLVVAQGAAARLEPGASESVLVKIGNPGQQKWNVQLNHSGLRFQQGDPCTVRLKLRASKPRRIDLGVSHAGPQWSNLGLYTGVELSPDWKDAEASFVAKESAENARVHLDLGGVDGDVEIGKGSIQIGSREFPLSPSRQPPSPAPAGSAAAPADPGWSFHNGGLNASVVLISANPWQVRIAAAGAEGRATLTRRVSGSPAVVQIRGARPATVEVRLHWPDAPAEVRRIDVSTDWRRVEFPQAAGARRIEVDVPATAGTVEVAEPQ